MGLLFAWAGQAVLAEEAGDGVVGAKQVELVLESLGAEAGLVSELDDLACEPCGRLMRAAFGGRPCSWRCEG